MRQVQPRAQVILGRPILTLTACTGQTAAAETHVGGLDCPEAGGRVKAHVLPHLEALHELCSSARSAARDALVQVQPLHGAHGGRAQDVLRVACGRRGSSRDGAAGRPRGWQPLLTVRRKGANARSVLECACPLCWKPSWQLGKRRESIPITVPGASYSPACSAPTNVHVASRADQAAIVSKVRLVGGHQLLQHPHVPQDAAGRGGGRLVGTGDSAWTLGAAAGCLEVLGCSLLGEARAAAGLCTPALRPSYSSDRRRGAMAAVVHPFPLALSLDGRATQRVTTDLIAREVLLVQQSHPGPPAGQVVCAHRAGGACSRDRGRAREWHSCSAELSTCLAASVPVWAAWC